MSVACTPYTLLGLSKKSAQSLLFSVEYSQVPLLCASVYYDLLYSTVMTDRTEITVCNFVLTKDTPDLSLFTKYVVSCGDFGETWPLYNRTESYIVISGHVTLQWRRNERDGVPNHQPHDCILNSLFRRRSNKTSKLRVTGLCAGNSQVTGEFPAQRVSIAENVSIWWRHHDYDKTGQCFLCVWCLYWSTFYLQWKTLTSLIMFKHITHINEFW